MDKYEQISVVGEGSYGLVMKCRHRETDQIVAVKKFLETEEDATIRKMALREIRMLKRLKHENLVTMIEVFRYRKRFYLVFEYLEGTVLDELEKLPSGLGDERSRERIYQVARAVSYCHSNHIIHRDVKPENVLVSSSGVVKLCDFGFARLVSSNGEACTEYVATRWYRAPELLVGEPIYGPPVDVWAIGCLFAEMMTGDPIFPGESDIDQLYLIVKMLGKPCTRHQQLMMKNTQMRGIIKTPMPEGFFKTFPTWTIQAIEFISGCMKMDPQERLSADELLKHPYFTHDKFPQRFLPALREKVNAEFNNPLLRKFKTEILMSTDKKDETKPRRSSQNDTRWRINLNEGSMKRKYSCDTITCDNLSDKNLITLAKSSQRLSVIHKQNQKLPSFAQNKEKNGKVPHQSVVNNAEIHMLEKSLETLVKLNKSDEVRPLSRHKDDSALLLESPQPFNFGIGDCNKSPNVLHPSINNISFNKDTAKRSPNVLQCFNSYNKSQNYLLSNPRAHFLKKLERNAVIENIFATGDQGNAVNMNNAPVWLNSFPSNIYKKKEPKGKIDSFSLPNVPGATASPNKVKKKTTSDNEALNSNEVTPRLQSATSHKSQKTPPLYN